MVNTEWSVKKMTERYISVTDDEYCYFLDTKDKNYKTLEDFEKQEFKNAKKEGKDIKEYEDDILQVASDKYWEWVYDNHLECSDVEMIVNKLYEENQSQKDLIENLQNELNFDAKQYKVFIDIINEADDLIKSHLSKHYQRKWKTICQKKGF